MKHQFQHWIFKMRSDRAKEYISGLRRFYNEGERNFNSRLKDLEKSSTHLTQEEWDLGEGDLYIDLRRELEESRQLTRHFAIVGLSGVFEKFLRDTLQHTLRHLHWEGANGAKCNPRDHWTLDDMKRIFAKIGVPVTKPDHEWKAVKKIKTIRDCIAHHGDRPDKRMVKKLKDYDFHACRDVWAEDQPECPLPHNDFYISWEGLLKLPDGYFEESGDLVKRVCKRIAKDCRKAVQEKHIKGD